MPRRPTLLLRTAIAVLALPTGCAALSDSLDRAEDAYEQAAYDDSLVWLAHLEDDVPDMTPEMRARYFYLRGMGHHRVGRRDAALYDLGIAREVAGDSGRGLAGDWSRTLTRTLEELVPEEATHHARRAP